MRRRVTVGWSREDLEGHEGWVTNVLRDGRTTGTTTGAGVFVRATAGDEAAGYQIQVYEASGTRDAVVPWDQVVGWRICCECGWHGRELAAYTTGSRGQRHCPEELEKRELLPEWSEHVDALANVAGLADLCAQARHLEREIADRVATMREAGISWTEIGKAARMTRQGAQQRWSGPATAIAQGRPA
jgi:hypothetical protein